MNGNADTEPVTRPDLSERPFAHPVERDMVASPPALYKAWTQEFDRWFAAPGSVLMRGEVDEPYFFETEYAMDPGQAPKHHPHYGRFLSLDRDRRVEMTWVTGSGGTEGAETVLTIEFEPAGTGTHLRLTQAGFPHQEATDRNAEAWPQVLAHLDEVLMHEGPD